MVIKPSIRSKILVITVIAFFLAIGINTFIVSRMFRREYSAALQSKINVVANTLRLQMERLLELGIAAQDIEGFETQCQEVLRKHKDVAYALVARTSGEILFHNDPTHHGTAITDPEILKALQCGRQTVCLSQLSGRVYHNTVIPIQGGSEEPGITAIVGFPMALIEDKIQELRDYSLMVALISLGVATALLLTSLSFAVTKPLSRLVTTIQQIRDSSDLSKRIEITSRDELGDLAQAFNHMAEDLQRTTTSIDNLNRQISERKRAEEAAKLAYEKLEQANKQLQDMQSQSVQTEE